MNVFKSIVALIRVKQWLKNLIIFFPPFLGGTLLNFEVIVAGLIPFAAFSALSSTTYIINDIIDLENDRNHPEKKQRPLPSGSLSKGAAIILATLLILFSLIAAQFFARSLFPYFGLYLLVTISYSFALKNIPVLDLFCISSGFIIRLMAGGAIFSVPISEWLFLSVLLLSLFLSTGKRMGEKMLMGVNAAEHRKVLAAYPEGFLDNILILTSSSVLVTYSMYAVNRHSFLLLATVPLCCFGLMRYILCVKSGNGGDPTEALTKDFSLLLTGLIWSVMIGWGIYGGR